MRSNPINKGNNQTIANNPFITVFLFSHTQILNLETMEYLHCNFRDHEQKVISLIFDPFRDVLISGSEDETIRVWDLHDSFSCKRVIFAGGTVKSMAIMQVY